MKIKDFLNRDNWIRGNLAEAKNFRKVKPKDPEAIGWSVYGAILKNYNNIGPPVTKLLSRVHDIVKWNDNSDYETVRDILEELDI